MNFKSHPMAWVLLPLCLIALGWSFDRFVIAQRYVVEYQGDCDPGANNCFVACDDDSCSSSHNYAKVRKYAPDLQAECGSDVTGCVAAGQCLPADRDCSVTYCSQDALEDGESCSTQS